MKKPHRYMLLAFIAWANLKGSFSLPVPEDELDTSTRLLGSSVVTSVSVVTGNERSGGSPMQSRKIPGHDLPPSPAGLLRPDRFQFYTLNKNGEVVTKQMTEKEIQTLIAAGGGHLPTEIHESQMTGDVPNSGMKVSDVVQNVQNVLKSELSKPTTVMTSVPTIPGHATDEWSSILPSILAGDMETQSLNIPDTEITEVKHKVPVTETVVKPEPVKPLPEATSSGSKLKPNTSPASKNQTKESENHFLIENHFKKPIMVDKHDSVPGTTHYQPISTSKPNNNLEKLPNSDPLSKTPVFSSSEKPTVFQKPSNSAESVKQKPQISIRPDPGTYEQKPLVSVGSIKKPSSPAYNPVEKQTQSPLKTTKRPFETYSKPYYTFRPEFPPVSYSEIPMIPVHVITADQILTTPQYQKDNTPVFQVLNTISADTANVSSTKITNQEDKDTSKYSYPVYKPEKPTSEKPKTPLPEIIFSETSLYTKLPEMVTAATKTETPVLSVVSETHSTSVKIPGHPEVSFVNSGKPTTPKSEVLQKEDIEIVGGDKSSGSGLISGSADQFKPVDKIDDKTFVKKPSSNKPLGNKPLDKPLGIKPLDKPLGTKPLDKPSSDTLSGNKPSIPSFPEDKLSTQFYESETTTQLYETKVTNQIFESKPTQVFEPKPTTELFETRPSTQFLESKPTTQLFEFKSTTDLLTGTTVVDFEEKLDKDFETTEHLSETSTVPAVKETQFQKIPDLTPDKMSPETFAIEKIIETLHHPTESKFGTSTIIDINTEFAAEPGFSTTFKTLDDESSTLIYTLPTTDNIEGSTSSLGTKTSTVPTLLNVDNASEGTTKPYEPLPTELADSLSSMISQISEAVPSLISQTTLLTEESEKEENEKYGLSDVGDYQQSTESTKFTADFNEFKTTVFKNVDTGATVRLEDATEALKDGDFSSSFKPVMETSTSGLVEDDLKQNEVSTVSPYTDAYSKGSFSAASILASEASSADFATSSTASADSASGLKDSSLASSSTSSASSSSIASSTASVTDFTMISSSGFSTSSTSSVPSSSMSSTTASSLTSVAASSSTSAADASTASAAGSSSTSSADSLKTSSEAFSSTSKTAPFITWSETSSAASTPPSLETSAATLSTSETLTSSTADSTTLASSATASTISSASSTPSTTSAASSTASEASSTTLAATSIASSAAPLLTSSSATDTTEKSKLSSLMEQTNKVVESEQDQIPQSDESYKLSSIRTTEKPIIRIDVTDSGKVNDNLNGVTESLVTRIHMSDAVSMINNLLETAPAQTTASYVSLSLPEDGMSSPNIVGSSLVAGFLPRNKTAPSPVKLQSATVSKISSNSEINVKPAFETKTEDTLSKIKDSSSKIKNTSSLIKDTLSKIKDTTSKIEGTSSKVKDTVSESKVTEDEIKETKNKVKLDEVKIKDTLEKSDGKDKTKDSEGKIKDTDGKTKDTEDKIKIPESGTKITGIKIEDAEKQTDANKIKDSPEKTKVSEEKIKIPEETTKTSEGEIYEQKIKHSEETIKNSKDRTKVPGDNVKVSEEKIKNTINSKIKENIQKFEEDKKKIEVMTFNKPIVTSVEKGSTKDTSSNQEKTKINPATVVLDSFKESTPKKETVSDSTTNVDIIETVTKKVEESKHEEKPTKVSATFETSTTYSAKKNPTKAPNRITTESIVRKETVNKLDNIPVISTTPKSHTKVATTPKSNIETTTPKSKITLVESSKIPHNTNKTKKPEVPVVRIDLSPETNHHELEKIPDLLSSEIINSEKTAEKISISSNKLSPNDTKLVNSTVSKESTKNDDKLKRVDATTVASVDQGTKISGENQEIRIRVNDTAVLVSKISPVMMNDTKISSGNKGVESGSKVSIKDELAKRTEDKINLIPQILKNSSDSSSNIKNVHKEKPVDTKIVDTVQSDKVLEDLRPVGLKPISSQTIDQTLENAYNKLGESGYPYFVSKPSGNKPSSMQPLSGPSGVKTSTGPSVIKTTTGPSAIKTSTGPSGVKTSTTPSEIKTSTPGVTQTPSGPSVFKIPITSRPFLGPNPHRPLATQSNTKPSLGSSGFKQPATSSTTRPSSASTTKPSSSASSTKPSLPPSALRPSSVASTMRPSSASSTLKPLSTLSSSKPSSITAHPSSGPNASRPSGVIQSLLGSSAYRPPSTPSTIPVRLTPTKSSFPSKSRPSSHETVSYKPTEPTKKKPEENLNTDDKWALIPQQTTPSSTKTATPSVASVTKQEPKPQAQQPQVALDASQSAVGLDGSIKNLDSDVIYFSNLCNELAFSFWSAANKGLSTTRSLALSPFGMTSLLAMVFLGARGPTSDEMNDVLKLDDVSTFNPHLVFQNVTDTVSLARKQGIANAAFVRELFADKSKVGKLMPFYKEQAQQFYEGFVEEVNFAAISDIVRRRTNLLIRKQTGGRIRDFVRTNTVGLRSPLAALSANVFQTECSSGGASSEGRDGELYFAVSPAVRQRKLIPVPATVWKSGVLAGYEPSLDATAIALGGIDKLVSTIFVVPGQQGHMAPGDNLDNLEVRLVRGAQRDGSWEKLLKVLIPRPSLELQVPKFSHRSIVNATAALKRMGLGELFTKHADLKGINGIGHDLHLADVLQMNLFSTCGDENISSGRHHVEIYPGPPTRNYRKMSDSDEDSEAADDEDFYPEESSSNISSFEDDSTNPQSLSRTSRQAEISEKPRLKLDRPFLYFVRHNPTGLILHMGRFNPRLLP